MFPCQVGSVSDWLMLQVCLNLDLAELRAGISLLKLRNSGNLSNLKYNKKMCGVGHQTAETGDKRESFCQWSVYFLQ